jgi:hypothetical protein
LIKVYDRTLDAKEMIFKAVNVVVNNNCKAKGNPSGQVCINSPPTYDLSRWEKAKWLLNGIKSEMCFYNSSKRVLCLQFPKGAFFEKDYNFLKGTIGNEKIIIKVE